MRVANGALGWATVQTAGATYIASGDISTDLYSKPICIQHLSKYVCAATIAGATPTGTLKLQACVTDLGRSGIEISELVAPSAGTWVDVDGSSVTISATGTTLWNVADAGYLWVRVVWTKSGSAAGTVSGAFNGKGET